MRTRDIIVDADRGPLPCLLAEPESLAPRPALLLNFAADRYTSIGEAPFDIPARAFVAAGHRVLSFDLPFHGEREIPGRPVGIAGFCDAFAGREDPFAQFVAEGRCVLDAVIRTGLAEAGQAFVAGTSRGGYCALRLMAADARIGGGAAYAPVTDWRVLQEFAEAKERPEVAALALTRYAAALAGRPVWVAIGNADARVGTDRCLQFALSLAEAESAADVTASRVQFHVVPETGHSLSDDWRSAGARFLVGLVRESEGATTKARSV